VVDVLLAILLALVAEPEEGNLQESGVRSKRDLKQLAWREPPLSNSEGSRKGSNLSGLAEPRISVATARRVSNLDSQLL
jgi:hypothetical protein